MEEIDRIITTTINAVIGMEGDDMESRLRNMISVRMSIGEGLGYIGGQRLAHMRPDLLLPALELFSSASWSALRRSRFNRGEYRSGFHAGFQDELDGTAHPLLPELPLLSQ